MEFDIQPDSKEFRRMMGQLDLDAKQMRRINSAGGRAAGNVVKKVMKSESPSDTKTLEKSWHVQLKYDRKTESVTVKVRPNPKKRFAKGGKKRYPAYTAHFADKGFRHWKSKRMVKGNGAYDKAWRRNQSKINSELRAGRLKSIKREIEKNV
ncbi:hypothetical protein KS4_18130 [Poriferisphaera corsica]|uniref:Uncharacterized protein n=1 Tax=Poriferisphaera corsica TaxID=2528020 RepID=A0A517YU68_9BACT|nr:HK97 gp10 family phage protein [Poriferisphaera corsica]QDU33756.1 hypothetical protein KS4_18130 [Poriferisphaera corsica]